MAATGVAADDGAVAYDLDRRPAEWVTAQASSKARQVWLLLGVAGVLLAGVLYVSLGLRSTPLTFVGLALMLLAKPFIDPRIDNAMRWRKGARAEATVGEVLNELRSDGFVVMHDLKQAGEGNVDHLVSGPTGVYLVETKHRSYRPEDLRKAKRQAAKMGRELGVWVTPVICLVEREAKRPYRHDGVWIVNRHDLTAWIARQRNATLAFDRLARFADRAA